MPPMMFGFAAQRKKILESEIERFISEMPQFGAKKVILIGDMVNGKINIDSGIELIITQNIDKPFKDRSDFWITHLRPSVKTDFYVYTPEELVKSIAMLLDKYSHQTRFPTSLPGNTPYEVYDKNDSARSIEIAEEVMKTIINRI